MGQRGQGRDTGDHSGTEGTGGKRRSGGRRGSTRQGQQGPREGQTFQRGTLGTREGQEDPRRAVRDSARSAGRDGRDQAGTVDDESRGGCFSSELTPASPKYWLEHPGASGHRPWGCRCDMAQRVPLQRDSKEGKAQWRFSCPIPLLSIDKGPIYTD